MKRLTLSALALFAAFGIYFLLTKHTLNSSVSLVAIANYGPHKSLESTIEGIKEGLQAEGFIDGKNIRYIIKDVGFSPSLIPTMISTLEQQKPAALVTLTTPVAQYAKGAVQSTPLIYSAITDPVAAGLIPSINKSGNSITGSAETQNIHAVLSCIKKLFPQATRIGLLYSSSESNDTALLSMMRDAVKEHSCTLVAVSIDQQQDIPLRMELLRDSIDVLYVGTSGPIQPALAMIARIAKDMHIPVVNADSSAVKEGVVCASCGVNYTAIGKQAGKLIAKILQGSACKDLTPHFPTIEDHETFINKNLADFFKIDLTTVPPSYIVVK